MEYAEDFVQAAEHGEMEDVISFLKTGVDINVQVGYHRWSALIRAADNGHLDIVKVLLSRGAKPDIKTKDHDTALHLSTYNGHLKIVWELLKRGANANLKDENHDTPLMLAAWGGHTSIVALLLRHGAKVNLQDKCKLTALMLAARHGHQIIVQTLLYCRANPCLKHQSGKTARQFAEEEGHKEITACILDTELKKDLRVRCGVQLCRAIVQKQVPTMKQAPASPFHAWVMHFFKVHSGLRQSIGEYIVKMHPTLHREYTPQSAAASTLTVLPPRSPLKRESPVATEQVQSKRPCT